MTDPLLETLTRLPAIEPGSAGAERVRARCRATLERRTTRADVPVKRRAVPWEPALLGIAGIYVVETIRMVLRVYGIR
jgi:hypothetical protein